MKIQKTEQVMRVIKTKMNYKKKEDIILPSEEKMYLFL